MTRRPRLVALLGSVGGLAVMSGAFACYLSAAAQADGERIELYAAVFIGALIFATSAIEFCKLRGALALSVTAHPGHRIVNVLTLLLCGWLGYGFVTERVQPFGLPALLAMSALAVALGAHLMASRAYSSNPRAHAFTGRRHHHALTLERLEQLEPHGLLARIEWHGGEEQAWVLRETETTAPGMVRAAAFRHRRGWHVSGNMSVQKRGPVRQRSTHRAMYRQR
ncbi:NAD(P)(+) transhydrogenase (Re/Si-specific) subunit beta [Paraburkholderia sediminicola]|uniref:NAD(P)(+) transhydrogenase (Re/Si-specific) subunit beta n=1 Tax=Paraburkholderia sediminicola TaxID=458836 RepID=UPI0038BAC4B2